jgi:hypothetical protein
MIGFLALIWVLCRVIPKPSRANYPCVQAAAPVAWSFVGYILSLGFIAVLFRRAARYASQFKYFLAVNCMLLAGFWILVNLNFSAQKSLAVFEPSDNPNQPVGTAKGIFPGRVVWVSDPNATAWNGVNGNWWSDENTDSVIVEKMLSYSIQWLTEKQEDGLAWELLFRYHNMKANNENAGYQSGEKIAIKINMNNYADGNRVDASPQLVYGLLFQLVYKAGVPQGAITVYDAIRPLTTVYNRCSKEFPQVNYNPEIDWIPDAVSYSAEITDPEAKKLPKCVLDAKYIINMAILKRHDFRTAVTLCGKNHFGSIPRPSALHPYVKSWTRGMGTYDPQVDLMGSKELGSKTLLYLIDGLYGAKEWNAVPSKWGSVPFNNDWPSSLFMSQDPVAIDSVGMDFLRAECSLQNDADNYLHEAALADNPPSGTFYDPEGDGTRLSSLGVHEHWNNPIDKKYSRNLGTGDGIELIYVSPQTGDFHLRGDFNVDGQVNDADLKLLSNRWLTQQGGENWNSFFDIAPADGDGRIDALDFMMLSQSWTPSPCGTYLAADLNDNCWVGVEDMEMMASSWLSEPNQPGWNSRCDIAPVGGDEKIDFQDFAVLALEWMKGKLVCDSYRQSDFNKDCLVNISDLSIFASAWLSEQGQPHWDARCDIHPAAGDGKIEYADFCVLATLWQQY